MDTSLASHLQAEMDAQVQDATVRVNDLQGVLTVFVFRKPHHGGDFRRLLRRARSIGRKFSESTHAVVKVVASVGDEHLALEDHLMRKARDRYRRVVEGVVCVPAEVGIEVWIRPTKLTNIGELRSRADLANTIASALGEKDLRLAGLHIIGHEAPRATLISILRVIKIIQPATIVRIQQKLRQMDYQILEGDWLQHQVDRLRKEKRVVRSPEGQYCLTPAGLRGVPGRPGKDSADVQRALEIAGRRTWELER